MIVEYFVDIELRPNPEIAGHQLLAALYTKLHNALSARTGSGIAVCFPDYRTSPLSLGSRLRLLGNEPALKTLMSPDSLGGLRDHVNVSAASKVPTNATHRALRRVQAKSNPERLRRRVMSRHGLDQTQARERIPDTAAEMLHLPFLQLRSGSTGHTFRLFLSLSAAQPKAITGDFNAYGFSQTATIPWF